MEDSFAEGPGGVTVDDDDGEVAAAAVAAAAASVFSLASSVFSFSEFTVTSTLDEAWP